MKLEIVPSALGDLADGFRFYEKQQRGVGSYFLESLFSDIDSLKLYAGIHMMVFGYHRLLSKRFPYAVYYSKEAEKVVVHAVLSEGPLRGTVVGNRSGFVKNSNTVNRDIAIPVNKMSKREHRRRNFETACCED